MMLVNGWSLECGLRRRLLMRLGSVALRRQEDRRFTSLFTTMNVRLEKWQRQSESLIVVVSWPTSLGPAWSGVGDLYVS